MNLNHQVALVMGGARMGVAVGRRLARAGYSVCFGYRRSADAAKAAAAVVSTMGADGGVVQCDLASPASIRKAVGRVVKVWRRLDVVVNLASLYEEMPPFPKDAGASWEAHLNANARGAFELTRRAAPLLNRSPRARVIHISDWTSASGRPRYADFGTYYVSKAAIKAVVETLALEFAPKILINAIAPGPMLPPPGMSQKERKAVEQATPLRRWGGEDEIAKAVMYLVETEFMTGETIRVDGGRHLY